MDNFYLLNISLRVHNEWKPKHIIFRDQDIQI